ncbi:MAG: SusD/RagB family nutrient-binding outer membrane lipoprotein, partial [Alistipes sp.]|nr:SusD/RagB family nutrient-binding outer membrane lipoprotein [Alistipes sp.]
MKFNISNIKAVFAVAALGAASCTANYEDINRNPYEVTGEEMERDGYAMRSFMTTMQSWVVPTDRNQCQFTDVLLGGPYGGYITDANSGFNAGKFSTYDPQSNWSPVFYRVVYTNEMSNYSELCKVTEDENAIAVAKVVKVAGVHRVTDTYCPI